MRAKEYGAFSVTGVSIHHIVPLSMGGTNDFTNMMPLPYWPHNRIHIEYDKRTKNLQIGESMQVDDLSESYKSYEFRYINKKKKKKTKRTFAIPYSPSEIFGYKFKDLINPAPKLTPLDENLTFLPSKNNTSKPEVEDFYVDAELITTAFWFDSYSNIRIKQRSEQTIGAVEELKRIGIDTEKFNSLRIEKRNYPYWFLKTNNEEKIIITKIRNVLLEKQPDEIFESILNCYTIDGEYSLILKKNIPPSISNSAFENLSSLGFTGHRAGKHYTPQDDNCINIVKNIYEFGIATGVLQRKQPLSTLTIKALSANDKSDNFIL